MSEEIQEQVGSVQTDATETTISPETTTGASSTEDFGWDQYFQDADLGYVENKGWQNPADAVNSYRELEKFKGADENSILRLPKEQSLEAMSEVFDKLGRPESPDAYSFTPPEGLQVDQELESWFKGLAHEAGLNPAQAEKLYSGYNALGAAQQQQLAEEQQRQEEQKQAEFAQLRERKGVEQFEQITKAAGAMLGKLGIGDQQITDLQQAWGYTAVWEFCEQILNKVGEDDAPGAGGGNSFGMTREQAMHERQTLLEDIGGDPARYEKYVAKTGEDYRRMEHLTAIAYPGA